MRRRLSLMVFVVGVAAIAAGCGQGSGDSTTGAQGPSTVALPPPTTSGPDASAPPEGRRNVIVDLKVDRSPEGLRSRVEAAQDQVLRDLGAHGQLLRRLTETAQMAVSVDPEGHRILSGHPLVARVHDDVPQPAGAGQSTTPRIAAGTAVPRQPQVATPPALGGRSTADDAPAPSPGQQASTTVGIRQALIVDLRADRSEPELVEAAQDQVLRDLGSHGELSRRLTESAQMAVSVDAAGQGILSGHPLVARVHQNRPQAADPVN